MSAYLRASAMPFLARMCVIAAVSVVLPWSTCPIVPTFTCGLVRSNLPLAMFVRSSLLGLGADHRLGDALRRLGVMLEFHRVRRAALSQRAQRGRVAEHLVERHFSRDRLGSGEIIHAQDDATSRRQVADHVGHL